jgi:hypothetical protein
MTDNFPDTIDLSITQENIDQGMRGNCYYCAVSLAMAEAYPSHSFHTHPAFPFHTHPIFPYRYHVKANTKPGERPVEYRLGKEASRWVFRFDHRGGVSPITMLLERVKL